MFLIGSHLSHRPRPCNIQGMPRTTASARKTTGGTAPRKDNLKDIPSIPPSSSESTQFPAEDTIGEVSNLLDSALQGIYMPPDLLLYLPEWWRPLVLRQVPSSDVQASHSPTRWCEYRCIYFHLHRVSFGGLPVATTLFCKCSPQSTVLPIHSFIRVGFLQWYQHNSR